MKKGVVILLIGMHALGGLHAQYFNYPGIEFSAGAGASRNHKNYFQNYQPLCQFSTQFHVPVIWDKLYLLPGLTTEFNTRGSTALQETRMLNSQALFITPKMRLEYMWTENNRLHYSLGLGKAQRFKAIEYNLWENRPRMGFPSVWANQANMFEIFGRIYVKKNAHEMTIELNPMFENYKVKKGEHQILFNGFVVSMGWAYRPNRKVKPTNNAHIKRTLIGGESIDLY